MAAAGVGRAVGFVFCFLVGARFAVARRCFGMQVCRLLGP
jgi:hypothetical protein